MSEAIELFHQDGKPSGIFYCSTCRCVHVSKERAVECHGPRVCSCGKPIESRYASECPECDRRKWQEKIQKDELDRFEAATKIKASEFTGDQAFWDDKYYDSVEDALDGYLKPDHRPEYIWAAKNQGLPKASLDDLIERVIEGAWEDADSDDLNGVEELQAAVDKFNEENAGVPVYMPDFTLAILIDIGGE